MGLEKVILCFAWYMAFLLKIWDFRVFCVGLEVVLSSCVTSNKKTKTMPVLISPFKKLFFYCSGSLLLHGLSLSVASGGYSSWSVQVSPCNLFFCSRAWALGHVGFNSYGLQT